MWFGFWFRVQLATQESGIWENLFVSFIFRGIVVGNPFEVVVWCLAVTTFFIDLGEEIAADSLLQKGRAADPPESGVALSMFAPKSQQLIIAPSSFCATVQFVYIAVGSTSGTRQSQPAVRQGSAIRMNRTVLTPPVLFQRFYFCCGMLAL